MKKLVCVSLLIFALHAPPAWAKASNTLSLNVDHGSSLTLAAPAASVFIANPDIADVQVMSPTQVMLFGKKAGETSFLATDAAGHTLAERTVVVSQDLSVLREELNAAIPGNNIKARSVPGGIVLTGEARDPASVADAYKIAQRFMPAGGDIINRVQVSGSNQIQIRVRFAEVQRSVNNSLGVDWQNVANVGGFVVGLATGSIVNGVAGTTGGTIFNQDGTGLFPRPANSSLSTPNDVIGVSRKIGNFNLNGMIDALAQEGLVTVLAEPNLTAMSGETANFLAGGEFPIPVPQGNNAISITFKSYGVSLSFTPTLLAGDRISLHVRPEVSQLTTNGSITIDNIVVPALTTRKAETTVEVGSGESFAIAGLMDNNQAQTVNKYPLLGDLPVLGALFRSNNFQNGQTELIVVITPYLVRPSVQTLSLPTDHLTTPTEGERLVGLRQTGNEPTLRPISGQPTAIPAVIAAPAPGEMPAPQAAPVDVVVPVATGNSLPAPPIAALPVAAPVAPEAEPTDQPLIVHPQGQKDSALIVE